MAHWIDMCCECTQLQVLQEQFVSARGPKLDPSICECPGSMVGLLTGTPAAHCSVRAWRHTWNVTLKDCRPCSWLMLAKMGAVMSQVMCSSCNTACMKVHTAVLFSLLAHWCMRLGARHNPYWTAGDMRPSISCNLAAITPCFLLVQTHTEL